MFYVSGEIPRLTTFERFDVDSFLWLSNSRLYLRTTDYRKGRGEVVRGSATYAVNVDGSQGNQTLFDRDENPRFVFFFQERLKNSETDILALSNQRGTSSFDLVRLNTVTMKWTLLSNDNPGYVERFHVDKDLVPRAAMSRSPDWKEQVFYYKDAATSPWREVARFPALGRAFRPYDFLHDGTLLVVSNVDDDLQTLYKFDPKTGKPGEKFLAHPTVDITEASAPDGGLDPWTRAIVNDPITNDVIGVRVVAEKPQTFWFLAKPANLQKTMDAALPAENVNSVRR